jgi:hypothetical protein
LFSWEAGRGEKKKARAGLHNLVKTRRPDLERRASPPAYFSLAVISGRSAVNLTGAVTMIGWSMPDN